MLRTTYSMCLKHYLPASRENFQKKGAQKRYNYMMSSTNPVIVVEKNWRLFQEVKITLTCENAVKYEFLVVSL